MPDNFWRLSASLHNTCGVAPWLCWPAVAALESHTLYFVVEGVRGKRALKRRLHCSAIDANSGHLSMPKSGQNSQNEFLAVGIHGGGGLPGSTTFEPRAWFWLHLALRC